MLDDREIGHEDSSDEEVCRRTAVLFVMRGYEDLEDAVRALPRPMNEALRWDFDYMAWDDLLTEVRARSVEVKTNSTNFSAYIFSAIRARKLTGLQAKEMIKTMKIERARELDTPETIARAKKMIDGFIAENTSG